MLCLSQVVPSLQRQWSTRATLHRVSSQTLGISSKPHGAEIRQCVSRGNQDAPPTLQICIADPLDKDNFIAVTCSLCANVLDT